MKYQINLHVDALYEKDIQNLTNVARSVLSYVNALAGDLTLVYTDEDTIRALNHQFAGLDQPTDVLSFVDGNPDLETSRTYYGDVVIAVPIAEQQARNAGHSLRDELTLLTTHGVLHLLGFNHSEEDESEKMWTMQGEILRHLGCEVEQPRLIP
jgi:probable rRNA maturation factor